MSIAYLPLDEYLHTNYGPDQDYADGRTFERNWGGRTHGRIQANLIVYLARLRDIEVFPELRIQVSPTRIRVPDWVTKSGMVEAESGILKTQDPDLGVPVAALFD